MIRGGSGIEACREKSSWTAARLCTCRACCHLRHIKIQDPEVYKDGNYGVHCAPSERSQSFGPLSTTGMRSSVLLLGVLKSEYTPVASVGSVVYTGNVCIYPDSYMYLLQNSRCLF